MIDNRANASRRQKVFMGGLLQGRIVNRIVMYWCLYHLVLWHGMFFLRYLQYRSEFLHGGAAVPFVELYGNFAWDNRWLVACVGLLTPIVIWDIVRLTHRNAGPLTRLTNTLYLMAEGQQVRQLKFRKGDLVEDLEKAFNAYLASLHARAHGAQLPPAQPAAAAGGTTGGGGELNREFAPILEDLEDIAKSLSSVSGGKVAERNSAGAPHRHQPPTA
jgi:hypothetical protein